MPLCSRRQQLQTKLDLGDIHRRKVHGFLAGDGADVCRSKRAALDRDPETGVDQPAHGFLSSETRPRRDFLPPEMARVSAAAVSSSRVRNKSPKTSSASWRGGSGTSRATCRRLRTSTISSWSRSTESRTALKLRAASVADSVFIQGKYLIASDSATPDGSKRSRSCLIPRPLFTFGPPPARDSQLWTQGGGERQGPLQRLDARFAVEPERQDADRTSP